MAIHRVLIPVLILALSGCVHDNLVTMRPPYAFPQHLISLCGRDLTLNLVNRGEFTTDDYTSKTDALLLSGQLLPVGPDVSRHIDQLAMTFTSAPSLTIQAIDDIGTRHEHAFPATDITCETNGEMRLSYAADSSYFWASIATKDRELILWTNEEEGLVMQNRWRETHRGIVGGEISGDAWSLFSKASPAAKPASSPSQEQHLIAANCANMSGNYRTQAQVIHRDGSLDSRSASDQFFRKEIVGTGAVAATATPTDLKLTQSEAEGITISLYNDESLLMSRKLAPTSLSCAAGRWNYRGATKLSSAWLFMAAGGGFYREDLSFWKDINGDLLVEGNYTQRGLLFLIPIGRTEQIFMAFPLL